MKSRDYARPLVASSLASLGACHRADPIQILERRLDLATALGGLSAKQRWIALRHAEGYTYGEIGDYLGISHQRAAAVAADAQAELRRRMSADVGADRFEATGRFRLRPSRAIGSHRRDRPGMSE